ncbi:hypothetical protein CapIbe_012067 [Capra ibex]
MSKVSECCMAITTVRFQRSSQCLCAQYWRPLSSHSPADTCSELFSGFILTSAHIRFFILTDYYKILSIVPCALHLRWVSDSVALVNFPGMAEAVGPMDRLEGTQTQERLPNLEVDMENGSNTCHLHTNPINCKY